MDILELLFVVPASALYLYGLSVVLVPIGIAVLMMAAFITRSTDRRRTIQRCCLILVPLVIYAVVVSFWPIKNTRMEDASMMLFIGLAILISPPSILLISIVAVLIYAVVMGVRAILGK